MDKPYDFHKYSGKPYLPLYKYFSNYSYAEDVIKNHRIHLEVPSTYNDLYDSAYPLTIDDFGKWYNTSQKICKMMRDILGHEYYGVIDACDAAVSSDYFTVNEFVEFICGMDKSIVREEVLNECVDFISDGDLMRSDNYKISCFSERGDSMLLWAYYANNYKGVCLEFDIESDPLLSKYCSKVNYTRAFGKNTYEYDYYFLKSEEWSHEQEWRIVCNTSDEYLPTTSIRSIILGTRIPVAQLVKFIDLGRENGLKVYKIYPDLEEFKLKKVGFLDT